MSGGQQITPVVVSDGLVTLEEAKAYLAIDIPISDDIIEERILATGRYLERKCGRRFSLFAAKARTLWPNVKGSLDLVDLLGSPTPTVLIDTSADRSFATVLASTDFELLPYPDDDEEAARYQEMAIISPLLGFDKRVPMRITGNWGYVEPDSRAPYEIRLAVLMILARWWKRKENPLMLAQMPGFGFHRMLDDDPDALRIIEAYTHPRKRRVLQ